MSKQKLIDTDRHRIEKKKKKKKKKKMVSMSLAFSDKAVLHKLSYNHRRWLVGLIFRVQSYYNVINQVTCVQGVPENMIHFKILIKRSVRLFWYC